MKRLLEHPRIDEPATMLSPELASQLAGYMRAVVTSGTGRMLHGASIPIAGKTSMPQTMTSKTSFAAIRCFTVRPFQKD